MSIPILFIYIVGIICFIFGMENRESKDLKWIIYLGLSFIVNLMGYYLSYTDTDYTQAAYLPLILLVITVLALVYTAWGMIPISESWDAETDRDDVD